MHPWHDVEVGDKCPSILNAVVEIPKGSRAKYELDKKTGLLIMDRVIYSSVHYPSQLRIYTKDPCEDHDPLDILVLGQESAVPLGILRAKVIGVMKMIDQGEADDKIIAMHADDPEYAHYRSVEDLSPHRMIEVKMFFEDYKILENKIVKVDTFLGKADAFRVIDDALVSYRGIEIRYKSSNVDLHFGYCYITIQSKHGINYED